MICAFAAIYGAYSWTQLTIEAYPDIADTSSQVVTQAPGMAAEEIEQRITIPLERELNGTPGLLFMRSKSTFGLSLITIVFRDGIETYWSRLRINERIQNVTLPPGISAGLDPVTSPTGQIFYYTVESDTKGIRELSEIERWVVIPALKQVPGIADVSNFGGITTQFQLELDPQQLVRFNLSLANVEAAINANSASAGGSVVTRGELGYVVRGIGLVQTLDDMGAIVVTQHNGTPILLRDLGRLKLANLERHGIVGKNRKSDVVEGTVLLLKGDNPSRVLEGVHAKIAELNERLAPDDVRVVPYYDRSDLVNQTVSKVSHTILQGIGLVFIVLILFLGSPRSALIVGITIPFAMATVFILMNLLQASCEPAVSRRHRLRHYRRSRHRDDGGHPAAPRGQSKRAARRIGCRRRRPAGRTADLLRDADHHHDLPAPVRLRPDRGEAVLSDGLRGGFCAVRRVVACARAGPRLGIPGVSQAAARVPQLRARPDRSRVSAISPPPAASAEHRLPHGRGSRRHRGGAGRDGLARILARARRRRAVSSWRDGRWNFPSKGERDGCRPTQGRPGISGGVDHRQSYRPQRRRHRSQYTVAFGSTDRPATLRHLACGGAPGAATSGGRPHRTRRDCPDRARHPAHGRAGIRARPAAPRPSSTHRD